MSERARARILRDWHRERTPNEAERDDRAFASRQAVTLEGLIAKADAALDGFRSYQDSDRYAVIWAPLAVCLEQAMATLQALPEAPAVVRVHM